MTVFENAAYPLRVSRTRRFSRAEITRKTGEVLERVGLSGLASRSATQLSGGQQQRLALARALAREPRLLLLDEPLSNLDAQLRELMRVELKRLQRQTGVTAVYVTHDQTEALAISDRIAVMRDGRIAQVGTPKDIYNRPNSEFVATFVGRSNLFRGVVEQPAEGDRPGRVKSDIGDIACAFVQPMTRGANVVVLVRPENVRIGDATGAGSPAGENRVTGTLMRETYLGETVERLVATSRNAEILVRAGPSEFRPGEELSLFFYALDAIAIPQQ